MAEKASDSIVATPGIKLEKLIDFKGDCIDPLALAIITESLEYALETSARRLKAAGKIYPDLGENPILSFVKALRDELSRAPQCQTEGPPKVIKPAPAAPAQVKPKTTALSAATAAEIKQVQELITTGGKGMSRELLESIKSKPQLLELVQKATSGQVKALETQAEKVLVDTKAKKKAERTLPKTWAEAGTPVIIFKGKGEEAALSGEYESPQALLNRLGIRHRGAKPDQVTAFQRAGFKVVTNGGDRPVKGQTTGFIVERIARTEDRYKKPQIKPEEKIEVPVKQETWFERVGQGGVILGWDWYNPDTDRIDPSRRKTAGVDEPPPPELVSSAVRTLLPANWPAAVRTQEPSAAELKEIEAEEEEEGE